jgi:signal transduction histidine kinase
VATGQERERLARELHDSLGQVLGYVSMQTQAIRKWLRDGDRPRAEDQLARLALVAQEAQKDLRENILSLSMGHAEPWSFFGALRHYLAALSDHYGLRSELIAPAGLTDVALSPDVGLQLLRTIQEAVSNARKHGGAGVVWITFAPQDNQLEVSIADDGCGFDPARPAEDGAAHYGLSFMHKRMVQVGGSVQLESQPGAGTRVRLQVPLCSAGDVGESGMPGDHAEESR